MEEKRQANARSALRRANAIPENDYRPRRGDGAATSESSLIRSEGRHHSQNSSLILLHSAFVEAACSASTMRNGRVNQSRVAVLTGLSRVEVRKLLIKKSAQSPTRLARTARVIDGWTSDHRYLESDGRPRRLRKSRTRKYVRFSSKGTLPAMSLHRALLNELRQMKAVRELDSFMELLATRGQRRNGLERRLKRFCRC